ncbi:hypothetical protein [Neobacillus niacini]|uniref:hypothetical protein n=1 Tax=Neobacillus niacini TaxID=86668 RepID=UPI003982EF91
MIGKIRKIFGFLLIITSLIFGAAAVGMGYGGPILPIITMYLLTSVLPLLLAIFLYEGKKAFMFNIASFKSLFIHPGIRIYVLITIITPLLLNILDTIGFNNLDRLSSPGDVYFQNISVDWLGYTSVFAGLAAFMCFIGIFVAGWKKSRKTVKSTFIITLALSVTISIMLHNDYKTINQDGLLISTLGNKENIAWSEVKQVNLKGNITSDGFSRNSGSSFKWKFVFLLKNGETEEFGPFSYSKYTLEDSLHIKDLLADKNIPITTDQLNAKEWDFVEIDMDYEKDANPEDFYSMFKE